MVGGIRGYDDPTVELFTAVDDAKQVARERLAMALADAWRIVKEALDTHLDGRELVGRVVLFSGGNDSTVMAHLFRAYATSAAHANTTVGLEATRQFVRDTCAAWDLPLLERFPPKSYAELVLDDWAGFPGPGSHMRAFQRLKERQLRDVRRELVTDPRRQRVLFLAGRRRKESARRSDIAEHEREGSTIWASPLANWNADDLRAYRALNPDCPRNPVSDALGMSGECLCGCFAEPGELERIRAVDPDCAAWLERLQAQVEASGAKADRCRWGWGAHRLELPSRSGRLCSSCSADPALALFDSLDDL